MLHSFTTENPALRTCAEAGFSRVRPKVPYGASSGSRPGVLI